MGIALSGLILVSTVLNFQTLHFTPGNDLPYVLFLPTYAATAWYHNALAPALQRRPVARIVSEVESFALGEYATALLQGNRLSPKERARIARRVSGYTGLPLEYVERADLRIDIWKFCKELLRGRGVVVGLGHGTFAVAIPTGGGALAFGSGMGGFGGTFAVAIPTGDHKGSVGTLRVAPTVVFRYWVGLRRERVMERWRLRCPRAT